MNKQTDKGYSLAESLTSNVGWTRGKITTAIPDHLCIECASQGAVTYNLYRTVQFIRQERQLIECTNSKCAHKQIIGEIDVPVRRPAVRKGVSSQRKGLGADVLKALLGVGQLLERSEDPIVRNSDNATGKKGRRSRGKQ